MSESMTYAQAAQAIAEMRAEIAQDENIASLRSYAVQTKETCQTLLQQEKYAEFDHSVRGIIDVFTEPVYKEGQVIIDASEASTPEGAAAILYSAKQPVSPNTRAGECGMSGFLQNSQSRMSSTDKKDADYDVLSHLAYASKFNSKESTEFQAAIQREGVTVKEYCEELLKYWKDDDPAVIGDEKTAYEAQINKKFLQDLANSDRFASLTIDHSVGNTGSGNGEHTQVLVIGCGDGHAVMAIQGTNGTTKDWMNDGKFAGSEVTGEEAWIASITNIYASEYDTIDLTGHSQGGRDAVTAAMLMDKRNQEKIQQIISNDGPGYSTSFLRKHDGLIRAIEDRVINIRPSSSFVGRIGNEIGIIKYAETIDIDLNTHSGYTWYLDENGNYRYTEADALSGGTLTQLVMPVVDFITTYMPEERLEQYTNRVLELLDDGYGNIDFGKASSSDFLKQAAPILKEGWDDFLSCVNKANYEQLTEFEYNVLIASQAAYEAFGLLDSFLGKLTNGCEKMEKYFPELSVGLEALLGDVGVIISAGKYAALAIVAALNVVTYIRAKENREARDAYISSNPLLCVNADAIHDAALALWSAGSAIYRCLDAVSEMKKHFKNRIRHKIINAAGLEEVLEDIENVTKVTGDIYCTLHGVSGIDYGTVANINKAKSMILQVEDEARNVLSGAGFPSEAKFVVNPNRLKSCASNGESLSTGEAMEQINKLSETDSALTSAWIGDDSVSHKALCDQTTANLDAQIDYIAKQFQLVFNIANAYLQFQENAISSFQSINL